jgi:hypothetical protein
MVLMMSVSAVSAGAEEDSLPDMELLEFLVEWETAEGNWLDPVELDEPVTPLEAGADAEVPHE